MSILILVSLTVAPNLIDVPRVEGERRPRANRLAPIPGVDTPLVPDHSEPLVYPVPPVISEEERQERIAKLKASNPKLHGHRDNAEALYFTCPTCHSVAGEACTRPSLDTATGEWWRETVVWFHATRTILLTTGLASVTNQ